MGQLMLVLAVGLVVGAIVFGVSVLLTGGDPGLAPAEADGGSVPLPTSRPLVEGDVTAVRFDVAPRGYRMAQVDRALQRAAYDIGYKDELINVLEAEVAALRDGRSEDAEVLRRAREAALSGSEQAEPGLLAAALAAPTGETVVDLGPARPEEPDQPAGTTPTDQPAEATAAADTAADTSAGTAAGTDAPGDEPPAEEAEDGSAADDALSGRR